MIPLSDLIGELGLEAEVAEARAELRAMTPEARRALLADVLVPLTPQEPPMTDPVLRPLAYLASPYTSSDPAVVAERVRQFALKAAELERSGKVHVLSAMFNHLLVTHSDLPTTWEFWKSYSLTMLAHCDFLYVLRTPGWDVSTGVAGEIEFAKERGIPVEYIDP